MSNRIYEMGKYFSKQLLRAKSSNRAKGPNIKPRLGEELAQHEKPLKKSNGLCRQLAWGGMLAGLLPLYPTTNRLLQLAGHHGLHHPVVQHLPNKVQHPAPPLWRPPVPGYGPMWNDYDWRSSPFSSESCGQWSWLPGWLNPILSSFLLLASTSLHEGWARLGSTTPQAKVKYLLN